MAEKRKSLNEHKIGAVIGPSRDLLVLEAKIGGCWTNVAVHMPVKVSYLTRKGAAEIRRDGGDREPGPYLGVSTDNGYTAIHIEQLGTEPRRGDSLSLLMAQLDLHELELVDNYFGL